MRDPDLTHEEVLDWTALLKAEARKGVDRLNATANTPAKAPKLTDAESAAIARARIDGRTKP